MVPLPEINATVSPDEADLGLRLRTAELEDGFFEDIDTEADEELKPGPPALIHSLAFVKDNRKIANLTNFLY